MKVTMITGDSFKALATLPDNSVHCVVTSPPYWGLRDYDVDGQIGMETSMAEHLEVLVNLFREVRRVLRPDGTVWVNYGDCYAAMPNGRSAADTKAAGKDDRTFRDKPFSTVGPISKSKNIDRGSGRWGGGNNPAHGYLKPKDLCMIPNRLAIALQDDGWWVRSEIIWHKPNPMPESVIDRPGTCHEKIFLLAKSPRYFYDAVAIREPAAESSIDRWMQDIENQEGSERANGGAKTNGNMKAVGGPKKDKQRGHGRRHAGFNERWDQMSRDEQMAHGRNKRNVWTIATKPFKDAHFATFPPELPEICIMAGTSERGCCPHCGTQWVRNIEKTFIAQEDVSEDKGKRGGQGQKPMEESGNWDGVPRGSTNVATLGWSKDCDCPDHQPVPCTVLDPFGGAGTTGLVAQRLQRNAILVELNPEYSALAVKRLRDDAKLFQQVEEKTV